MLHGALLRTVALLIASWLVACSEPQPPQLKVALGQSFPKLELHDLQGRPYTLDAATGKLLVLNFWATWCAPCRQEMPSLDRLSGLVDPDKVLVMGVSVDNDDHLVREFLIERHIFFHNLLDLDMRQSAKHVGIRAFPSTFFISPQGRLLKVAEGAREWDTPEFLKEINSMWSAAAAPAKK